MEDILIFWLKTLGLGLLTGFLIGYLFKKVSKIVLFIAAVIVVLVFVFGMNDILIDIDWLSLAENSKEVIDENIDEYKQQLSIWLKNLPFAIGIIAGFLYGLKKG